MRQAMSKLQPPSALEIRGLRKRFDRPAVDGLDLTVKVGEIYALLGPNGAGKTTALRMVAGLLPPDAGTISVLGIDVRRNPVAAKKVMAWIPDEPMIYAGSLRSSISSSLPGYGGLMRAPPRKAPAISWDGSDFATTPTSAASASRRACARRWRSPARWCMTRV